MSAAWRHLGIRGRLALAYGVILVVLLMGIAGYLIQGAASTLAQARLDHVRAAAARVALALDGQSVDDGRLADAAGGLVATDLAVLALDRDNRVLAAAGWPGLALDGWVPPAVGAFAAGDAETAIGQVAWATAPIRASDGQRVAVVGSLNAVDATVGEIGLVLVASVAGALVVGGIGIWWLTGQALAPVVRLAEASRRLAAGDRDVRVTPGNGSDEVATLAAAFNEMARRLDEQIQRQRAFVAETSHELRTPLTALVGSLDLLGRTDPDTGAKLRETMQAQLARLSRLVDDLLLIARLEDADPGTLRREPIDLGLVARDVVTEARHLPAAAGRTLTLDAPAEAPMAGDRDALHRMLLNLVANALEHGAGAVRLTVRGASDAVEVEVRDQGPGVVGDPAAVFDRYRRGPTSRGGAGLGLAIVRGVAERHGGAVSVRNDRGAIFSVRLPLSGTG